MLRLASTLALTATLACQQAPEPTTSPTKVDLGMVRVGAVVESTVHIKWHTPANGNNATVKLPANTQQLAVQTSNRDEGRAETRIGLAVSTKDVGTHDATIELSLGTAKATVEVTWIVEPAVVNGSRILAACSPFMGDSTNDPAHFNTWRELVKSSKLDVDYRYPRKDAPAFSANALARVDIVIAGENALTEITRAEIARLQGFICGGGRVIVFADAFFGRTTQVATRICRPFGMVMLNREPPPGPLHTAADHDLPRHALSVGVKELVVNRPSPTKITDPKMATALATLPTFGAELPFAAIATTKSGGELITIGKSLWWHWINQAPGNARLIRNLLVRPPRFR